MFYLLAILGSFFLTFQLVSTEGSLDKKEILSSCSESILEIVDDKVYLEIDKLFFLNNQFLLQNNQLQWVLLRNVHQDQLGIYLDMNEPQCPNGHTGILKVKGIWYCYDGDCRYFIGNNFHRNR